VTITGDTSPAPTWNAPRATRTTTESPVGARVYVIEPRRRPWQGTVLGIRLGLRCWYLQVLRDDGRVRSVAAHHVA
jgi:hypothetical protein